MSKTYVNNSSNRSLGRVGMSHGSCVHSSSSSTSSTPRASYDGGSSNSGRTYVDNSSNRKIGRVGEQVGSHVVHRDGSTSGSTAMSTMVAQATASSSSSKTYVDNSTNRSLGRVGKPVGSHVVHQDGTVTTSASGSTKCYVDNAYNRRLGRVGQPHVDRSKVSKHQKEQDLLRERNLDELKDMLRDLKFSDSAYVATANACHELQRSQVEETWKKSGIEPFTDLTKAVEIVKEIIPLSEIDCGKIIGEGSFGIVYAGLWKKGAIPIAFKKFIYQQITKKQQDLLVREIKIFAALDHPNIVKMFGVVVEKNNLGIVMEYLPKTLYHAIFIEEIKFSNWQKKKMVSEVVAALEYLHTPDDGLHDPKPEIAHCDVKSQNILLDCNNTVKLCDFGLSTIKNSAQCSSSRTSAVPGQGTPRYAAPEVLRGERLTLTGLMKSDIYSLSLVIFEVLVEEVPFEDLNLMQLQANVGRNNYRPPIEETCLTASIKQLLSKSWDKNAEQRPNIDEFSKKMSEIKDFFL